MSGLSEFLQAKRQKLDEQAKLPAKPGRLNARVVAEGRSGVRRIFIRDFQVITDSPESGAGYNLGPAPGELLIGAVAACLNHGYLIQAALADIRLDSLEVVAEAVIAPGLIGDGATGPVDLGLRYTARIASPASNEELEELRRRVERNSFVYNVVTRSTPVSGAVERVDA